MDEMERSSVTELIERARRGDDACRQRLFELCRGYLGLVARAQVESWLRVKVDASDVVQQTMLEAHRDFERFDGTSEKQWLGWLRGILRHNVSDFVRQYRQTAKRRAGREVRFRDPAETFGSGAPEPASPGPTPSEELVRLDDELRIAAALTRLPADYGEVIMLRNLQRLPFAEVARRMQRSRPATQMLWMRAIKRLQQLFDEEPDLTG